MKRILILILIAYVVFIAVMVYIYFGPGIISDYKTLHWQGMKIQVPKDFKVNTYQSKGWDVYSLHKLSVHVQIALKPGVKVPELLKRASKVIYRSWPETGCGYYIANPRKNYEVVFARAISGLALYFNVRSPSAFSAAYIMDKITAQGFYKGEPIGIPKPSPPLPVFITDIIFLVGMSLSLIIFLAVFLLSARKPSSDYFRGDPILCEENFVYINRVRKFRRRSSFCYLVLTSTRFMAFVFKKPVLEIPLPEGRQEIQMKGKKFIIQRANERIILRPTKLEKWKNALDRYI